MDLPFLIYSVGGIYGRDGIDVRGPLLQGMREKVPVRAGVRLNDTLGQNAN
jgi:hypothetical protein